jgi:hypothetical protein
MSNAIIVPDTFRGPVSSVFAGDNAGDDLSAGITGGYGLIKYRGKVWSIQYHGNTTTLMREDNDGPRGSIDVVIVKANPQLSKTWYEFGWDENSNNPPDCASANGITPDQGVPKKQSMACINCPKNAWGSDPKGGKGKACGDHRRLAVVPKDDLRNESLGGALLLRCPAASLQDMAAFDSRYKAMGYPYYSMAIKIGFDAQESYPKFTFAAIRPLTDAEALIVKEMRASPEVARVVSEGSAPAQAQIAGPAQGAFLEAPPPNAVQPQVQLQPAAAPAPSQPQPAQHAPEPAVAAQPAANPAAAPAAVHQPAARPAAVNVGGFGAGAVVQPAQPAPATAEPAPAPAGNGAAGQPVAARQTTMTGFGPVTPEVTDPAPAATQPARVAAPAVDPATQDAFAGSIDERLNKLLQ